MGILIRAAKRLCLPAAVVGILATAAAQAQTWTGTVTHIADGDSLRLTDTDGRNRKVRLADIDAPESDQAFGRECRRLLAGRISGQYLRLETLDKDRYGREVVRAYSINGTDIALAQLEDGCAWHYRSVAARRPGNRAFFNRYRAAEQAARHARRGLWQQSAPQAPWRFRNSRRHETGNGR